LIKFESGGSKEWNISQDGIEKVKLSLSTSSITNKFFIIKTFIENVSTVMGEEFDDWFIGFLTACEPEDTRGKVLSDNIENLKRFSDAYIDSKKVDYTKFVDETKVKKNSILFEGPEIEMIIRLSSYLKIYSLISNNETLKPSNTVHKEIYNRLSKDVLETEIMRKIYDVIKTKTFRYNLTDRYMWKYIENVQGKDIGIHVVEIFNFIINNILILCEEDKNPITYFVGVVDESVKWFLRSVYKNSVIYEDTISTEDIQGINVDNLRTYAFNDSLGRLKVIAFEKIYKDLNKKIQITLDSGKSEDDNIVHFHERLEEVQFVSPICETLVYPILSKMTNIPYAHFKTLSPEHAIVISVYLQDLFRKVFLGEFSSLFSLLSFYPQKTPSINTTYKIKDVQDFINSQDKKTFYGFNTKIVFHNFLCHYIGRISRIDFCNIFDGRKLAGIPLSKIETDSILFYTNYFSGGLDGQIKQMATLMEKDF
jgi:hypothetical protein